MQLEGEAFKPCTLKNFLVLLNNVFRYVRYVICKSRNFLVLLNLANMPIGQAYLQKQKFSCVTQLFMSTVISAMICKSRNFLVLLNDMTNFATELICKSRNFLVLLNDEAIPEKRAYLQKQKFSCVTQLSQRRIVPVICKSRNFLVLLNIISVQRLFSICKSRNFLVLLNPYSVIMHKYLLSNTHINHIFCKFFTTLSNNTS